MNGVPFFSLRRRARFTGPSLAELLKSIADIFGVCFKDTDDREMLLAIAHREARDIPQSLDDLFTAFVFYLKAKPTGYFSVQLESQDGVPSLLLSMEYIDLRITHRSGAWAMEIANHISYNIDFEAHVEVNTRNFPSLKPLGYQSPTEVGATRGIPFQEEFRD